MASEMATNGCSYSLPEPPRLARRLLIAGVLLAILVAACRALLPEWGWDSMSTWALGPLSRGAEATQQKWRKELHFEEPEQFLNWFREAKSQLVCEIHEDGSLRVFRRLDCGPTARPVSNADVPVIISQIERRIGKMAEEQRSRTDHQRAAPEVTITDTQKEMDRIAGAHERKKIWMRAEDGNRSQASVQQPALRSVTASGFTDENNPSIARPVSGRRLGPTGTISHDNDL